MWSLRNALPPAPEVPDEVQEREPGGSVGVEPRNKTNPERTGEGG
jgi:hypothetical protein